MNINSVKFNPSFQKKLVATSNILHYNKPCPISIYKIERKEDSDYFINLQETPEWFLSTYLNHIESDFKKSNFIDFLKGKKFDFYSMEDKKGNCIGLIEIDNSKKKVQNIEYFETFPSNRFYRDYQYIGETMLAFLAKLQQSKKKPKEIIVDTPMLDAQPFYKKAFMKYIDEMMTLDGMYLPKENEELLIKNNEKHTGTKIQMKGSQND